MKTNKYSLPLLLFDSKCTLCVRFKETLSRLPGASTITFVSIHDADIYHFYPYLSFEECQKELHFVDQHQFTYKGPQAIRKLSEQFPSISKFSWLIESEMGKKAIDYFYKMSDSYRKSLLNRCSTCK